MAQRVLVIDDEVSVLFAYQRLFSSQGYQLDACQTSEEASQLIKLQNPYDAVIADLRLSGHDDQDGLSLLHQAHDRSPATATFLITGHGSPETRQEVNTIGGIYLEKPVDPINVIAMLRYRIKPVIS